MKRQRKRPSPRAVDWIITVALGVAAMAWLLAVEGRQGFGRDEGQYMRAGERYWGWLEELALNAGRGQLGQSFTPSGIDRYWSDNAPDHPVIMKTLYGVSWRAFHRCTCTGPERHLHPIPIRGRHKTLPLFARDSTAFRFPAIVFAALLVGMVYRFARGFVNRPAAAAAATLAFAQPHYFFHAPIACFDAPITTMAFAVGFAYWKSLRSARWGLIAGVLFGLALGVKHNAWLMPIFLAGHYLWMRRRDVLAWRLPRPPLAFLSMLVLGPIIFFMHWPWLWNAPIARTRTYINRHLLHEHYNFEYLGKNWNNPPTTTPDKLFRSTAPLVETGLTVPATTLVLAALGVLVLARRRREQPVTDDAEPETPVLSRPTFIRPGADVDRAPGMFFLVQTVGPLAVLTIPSTPVFGGVKHFMPAMPYLAVMAGLGLASMTPVLLALLRRAREPLQRHAPIGLAALACLPAVVETQRSHPDGLAHYNLIAGGFAGGASLGMNRGFWGYAVPPLLDTINRAVPDNHAMYWHDVIGDAISMYKREGRLASSVGNTGFGEDGIKRSQIGVLFHEKHWAIYEGWLWETYGTTRPTYVHDREGVPIVIGYRRGAVSEVALAAAPPPSAAPPVEAPPSRLARLLRGWRGAVLVYLVFTGAYLGASGGRLLTHSPYNHYVYLAHGWLHGRLSLGGPPPNENDWAKIDVLRLRDGRELRGIYGSRTGGPTDRFYPLRGVPETVPASEIVSRTALRFVSFPPFPAVPMLPFVAVWGLSFNDVLFTALWAGLNPMLLFLLLRDLRARGLSRRTDAENLWLTALFGVGSVYYFCAVVGQVWFTAHIVAVTLSIGYVWASIGARHPVLAGLCVALGFATRPPWMVVPLFLLELGHAVGGWSALRQREPRRALLRGMLAFAAPIAAVGAVLCWHNWVRFQSPFEFGHKFLPVQWQERIFRFGLFNYHFLSRNLAAALVLLPRVLDHWPYIKVGQHGMSMLVTSPNLVYTVLPQERGRLGRALWITVAATAIPSLLYQNSGYVQVGYRFSLDYLVLLVALLAIGNRPLTRLFKGLVLFSFAVNLLLAITFGRYAQFTYEDSFFPHGNN